MIISNGLVLEKMNGNGEFGDLIPDKFCIKLLRQGLWGPRTTIKKSLDVGHYAQSKMFFMSLLTPPTYR